MQFIPMTTKELKPLNDLNQIVKKVFDQYVIARDSTTVVPFQQKNMIDKGSHFLVTPLTEQIMALLPESVDHVAIDSKTFFTAFRDEKKNITGLSIEEQKILLTLIDGRFISIGYILSEFDITVLSEHHQLSEWVLSSCDLKKCPDDYVARLMDKELVIIHDDNLRVRITKEIVPNLAKTSELYYAFTDELTTDPNRFTFIVNMEKSSIEHYHIYTCIRY